MKKRNIFKMLLSLSAVSSLSLSIVSCSKNVDTEKIFSYSHTWESKDALAKDLEQQISKYKIFSKVKINILTLDPSDVNDTLAVGNISYTNVITKTVVVNNIFLISLNWNTKTSLFSLKNIDQINNIINTKALAKDGMVYSEITGTLAEDLSNEIDKTPKDLLSLFDKNDSNLSIRTGAAHYEAFKNNTKVQNAYNDFYSMYPKNKDSDKTTLTNFKTWNINSHVQAKSPTVKNQNDFLLFTYDVVVQTTSLDKPNEKVAAYHVSLVNKYDLVNGQKELLLNNSKNYATTDEATIQANALLKDRGFDSKKMSLVQATDSKSNSWTIKCQDISSSLNGSTVSYDMEKNAKWTIKLKDSYLKNN